MEEQIRESVRSLAAGLSEAEREEVRDYYRRRAALRNFLLGQVLRKPENRGMEARKLIPVIEEQIDELERGG